MNIYVYLMPVAGVTQPRGIFRRKCLTSNGRNGKIKRVLFRKLENLYEDYAKPDGPGVLSISG